MVHVTDRAKQALLDAKRTAGIDRPDVGLRLTFGPDGSLGLVPDRQIAGDEVVKHEDVVVLLVDPEISATAITGRSFDCRLTPDGDVRFFLRPPKVRERRPPSAA